MTSSGAKLGTRLVSLMPAEKALLPEFQLADHSSGGTRDAHDTAMVHIDLADDQVIDAGHHLHAFQLALTLATRYHNIEQLQDHLGHNHGVILKADLQTVPCADCRGF